MKKHLVVALAYDQLCTFEFGCTVELFALDRPELGVPWFARALLAPSLPGPALERAFARRRKLLGAGC